MRTTESRWALSRSMMPESSRFLHELPIPKGMSSETESTLPEIPQQIRSLAALWLGGGTIALAAVLLPHPADVKVLPSFGVVAVALLIGSLLLWGATKLPAWVPVVGVATGSVV